MEKQDKLQIKSLSLISSVTCNLNCSFCYLNKNNSYKEFDKLVRQAWQNGSYIGNVIDTLDALNVDLETIDTLQLWGGEVLLRLEDILPNVKSLCDNFTNVKSWKISTNWMIDVEKAFNLIKLIDEYSHSDFVDIDLQISIDGPPGPITESGHHGNWDIYRKNFKKFTTLINNYKLNKVKISMFVNATVNKELYLSTFSNYEQIKNYMEYMANFAKEVSDLCISRSIDFTQILIYPGYATPYRDTAADGRKLSDIFRLWDQVYVNEFQAKYPNELGFFLGIGDFSHNKNLFENNTECNELKSGLTINYDGSICECSGSYIDYFEPYLKELKEKKEFDNYNIAISHNKLSSYNPKELTPDEIAHKKWSIHNGGYRHNTSTYLHMLISLGEELAESGQISSQYLHDKELLMKHCILLLNRISCSRNNIIDTHIPYLVPAAALRRYLNGAMDYVYQKGLEREKRREGKQNV